MCTCEEVRRLSPEEVKSRESQVQRKPSPEKEINQQSENQNVRKLLVLHTSRF